MKSWLRVWVVLALASFAYAQERPQDISGLYSFVRGGDTLQINVQPDGRVGGYVTHIADGESDRGQRLDLMFDKANVHGSSFDFHTRKIHGVWYEFKGMIERGKGQSRDQEAYYVIRGTLTTMREDAERRATPLVTQVEFKSFPAGM